MCSIMRFWNDSRILSAAKSKRSCFFCLDAQEDMHPVGCLAACWSFPREDGLVYSRLVAACDIVADEPSSDTVKHALAVIETQL